MQQGDARSRFGGRLGKGTGTNTCRLVQEQMEDAVKTQEERQERYLRRNLLRAKSERGAYSQDSLARHAIATDSAHW